MYVHECLYIEYNLVWTSHQKILPTFIPTWDIWKNSTWELTSAP